MPWIMVYATTAVAVLSVAGAWCAKGLRQDPWRLVAVIAAAALWPVVAVGLVQFGVIQLSAAFLRRHDSVPVEQPSFEPEPATAPMVLLDSLARIAQQVGAKSPV